MSKIQVYYTRNGIFRTAPLTQYDYGQKMAFDEEFPLHGAFEVHFSNDQTGQSVTTIGKDHIVDIPDECLTSGKEVYAWLFLHEGTADGRTVFRIQIPVVRRAQPLAREPTPVQQDTITQTIAALNDGVERAETAARKAEEAAEEAKEAMADAVDVATEAAEKVVSGVAEELQNHVEDEAVHLSDDEKEYLDNPPQFSGIGNTRIKELLGW